MEDARQAQGSAAAFCERHLLRLSWTACGVPVECGVDGVGGFDGKANVQGRNGIGERALPPSCAVAHHGQKDPTTHPLHQHPHHTHRAPHAAASRRAPLHAILCFVPLFPRRGRLVDLLPQLLLPPPPPQTGRTAAPTPTFPDAPTKLLVGRRRVVGRDVEKRRDALGHTKYVVAGVGMKMGKPQVTHRIHPQVPPHPLSTCSSSRRRHWPRPCRA